MDGKQNNNNDKKYSPVGLGRLGHWLLGLSLVVLLAAGCGGGPATEAAQALTGKPQSGLGDSNGVAGDTEAGSAGVDTGATSEAEDNSAARRVADGSGDGQILGTEATEQAVGDLLETIEGTDDSEEAPVTVDELRTELAEALLPPGAVDDDQALAAAISSRLGPDYAGDRDLASLIDALAAEVGETGPISSVDELVDRLGEWAATDVLSFGANPAAAASITASTSFDDVVALIEQPGVAIDLMPGVVPFDITGVEIDVDQAARRITVTGQLPAPLPGQATITMDWSTGQPQFSVDLNAGDVILEDLLPGVDLGSLGQVGATGLELQLDETGVKAAAQMIAGAIPGLEELGLGGASVPVELASAGLGPWSTPGSIEPISLSVPLGQLPPHGNWNTARTGIVHVTLGANPVVGYEERVVAQFNGEEIVFVGSGVVSGERLDLALTMDGDWVAPFGTNWLTLRNVMLDVGGSAAGQSAVVSGNYTVGSKTGSLEFAISSEGGSQAVVTGTLDDLVASDLADLARTLTGSDLLPSNISLPNDVLSLRNVEVSFAAGGSGRSFSLGATTELLGQTADAAFSIVPAADGSSVAIVAVQPRDVSLAGLVPALEGNEIVGDLRLPSSAFVFTSRDLQLAAESLDTRMASYLGATGGGSFRLPAGISLAGAIPGGIAPAIDDVKAALGIDPAAPVRLGGTLPVGALNGGGGDVVLEATLPTMSPSGSPEWFVGSDLALRITSQPSVGIAGSMTLNIQGDVQTFEIEASIARSATGVSVDFVGRLGNPWETPFDVAWLTLNEVELQLSMEPRGATIGFMADMIVGDKDLRGAVGITISPAGVPTNFAFEASSEAGVSLGDLATLYSTMSGKARPPVEAVLPAIEVRKINLRFAPVATDQIEQGFKVAGELWMANAVGGRLELVAATDIEVSDRGITADGYLTDFTIGPVEFDETTIALAVTPQQQRFAFSGGIDVAGSGANVAIEVTKSSMSFETTAKFGESEATLEIASSYDLNNPNWRVRAIMNEQFIRDVDVATEALLGKKISDINSQISTAKKGLATAQDALSVAKKALSAAEKATSWCGKFCGANEVAKLRAKVNKLSDQVRDLQNKVNQGEALLEQYDVQLTVVGAEFEASFGAIGSNKVTLNLIIDANGYQVPAPTAWDFDKSIDANLQGVIDQLVAL